jgi:hypothetical protein
MQRVLSLAALVIGTCILGAWSLFLLFLAFMGATTLPEDWQLFLNEKLPHRMSWLFSTPWWVPSILAVGLP